MRRKFLSVVLCVCMMLTMAPFAFAAEGDGESNIAVAKIGDTTYTTFDSALDNAKAGDTITLLENVTVHDADETSSRTTIDKSIILDLNGKTIFGPNNMGANNYNFAVLYISADTTIIDSASNGGINTQTNGAYCINVMDGAQLTINAGTYYGGGTAVQVQKGTLIINGGTFNCEPYDNPTYGYKFLINCVDSAYKDGTAKIIIKGGSFVNYNPSDSASENPRGNFCAPGYVAVKNDATENPVWTVEDHRVADVNGTGYTTLASAVEAADNKTVTLLKDVTESVVIPAGKTMTLDLNGHKLVNSATPQNEAVAKENRKHTITNNGTLTIQDSVGTGVVDNVSHQRAALYNNGTISEIKGGKFMRSVDNSTDATSSKGNSWYVVYNADGATISKISDGEFLALGHFSSLFCNSGTIGEICGGTFTQDGFIAFKNEGTITKISGGTFSSRDESCIQNWGTIDEICGGAITAGSIGIWNFSSDKYTSAGKVTNISGGEIKGTTAAIRLNDYDATSLKPAKPSSINRASATISGGKINGVLQVNANTTLTITGGLFTTDPSAYCETGKTGISSGDSTYPYTVGAKPDNSEPATVDSATVPANTTSTDATVIAAANSISGASVTNNNATEAATRDIANENQTTAETEITVNGQKRTVTQALTNISTDANKPSTDNPVTIVYQTYVDVTVTDAKKDSSNLTELTVNLTPMYRVVATTKNVTDIKVKGDSGVVDNEANAILIENAKKLNVPAQAYEVTLALPSNFDTTGNKLSIKHTKGNGSVEYYTGTVTTDDENNNKFVTFTTNGFSPFVIYAASANVASIGDGANQKVYPTLQAAIDAVQDGQTIKLTKACAENVTVSRAVKFTLNKDGKGFTGSISAGSRYSMTTSETTSGDTKYTFTYVGGGSSSSISTPTTYAVNVNAATNGAVAADKKTASKGTTVTVTASPSKGYVVDAVKVVDKDGKDVAVTEKDGKYVFTMPASAVTVTGSFKAETPAPVALPFTDVKSGNWFYDAVKYAYEQGLMTGTSATTFAPNGTMNRAMIVTVLYRLEKSPAVTGASKFTDVPAGQWYSDAVAWAAANKIVNGYDETTFGPMNAVTREQMAAILFRYEQVKGLENVTLEENLNRFPDQNKISAYAIPALQWAVGQKIINGNADGTLDPTGTATRAQVAQIFTNLLNK